jgi:hypothetical protein
MLGIYNVSSGGSCALERHGARSHRPGYNADFGVRRQNVTVADTSEFLLGAL